jgi:N-methylhydantoinase B
MRIDSDSAGRTPSLIAPSSAYDPIQIEVFKHLFASVAEEMGVILRRSAYSPNIKERRDFSCAVFDARGQLVAQAAHIPVHLGSMPLSVASAIAKFPSMLPGDAVLLNDPFQGGTHLPDITLVTPVFQPQLLPASGAQTSPFAFVASRAHHADVGGSTPGSMGIAAEIFQEGLIIPPVKLIEGGTINQAVLDLLFANVRTPEERSGDLWAQVAANRRGDARLLEIMERYGPDETSRYMNGLQEYAERLTRALITQLPEGIYSFSDFLDDDGTSDEPVPIQVRLTIVGDQAHVDFSGSALQRQGSVNAVYAITLSAVYYVFRCLLGPDAPTNAGSLVPIQITAPPGTVVNAQHPAPVAGGNVETSQRIVDILLGALAGALPDFIPAASQGTMNNVTIGGQDPRRVEDGKLAAFTYYETIGGGMGARPGSPGPSAVHSHMTNTLNTPVEALEYAYPLRVVRYEVRRGSGGAGRTRGGDGIRRDIQALVPARVSLITERRRTAPYGLAGGANGAPGENILIRGDLEIHLPGKGSFELLTGDVLSIRTPGGGGHGSREHEKHS